MLHPSNTAVSHLVRDMRDQEPIASQGDSAEHLPARTGQPDVGDEPIARRQQPRAYAANGADRPI
jgi:hypothetical protein